MSFGTLYKIGMDLRELFNGQTYRVGTYPEEGVHSVRETGTCIQSRDGPKERVQGSGIQSRNESMGGANGQPYKQGQNQRKCPVVRHTEQRRI